MKLSEYLTAEKMTAAAFAYKVARYPSTISRILNGKALPEWSTMKDIMLATKGAVTPNDFMPEL